MAFVIISEATAEALCLGIFDQRHHSRPITINQSQTKHARAGTSGRAEKEEAPHCAEAY